MSEYRQLHRSFWESGYVEDDLDAEGAWLYCYLIAGPVSNMEGLYKVRKSRICRETKLPQETVDKWLRRFESDGYASNIVHAGFAADEETRQEAVRGGARGYLGVGGINRVSVP